MPRRPCKFFTLAGMEICERARPLRSHASVIASGDCSVLFGDMLRLPDAGGMILVFPVDWELDRPDAVIDAQITTAARVSLLFTGVREQIRACPREQERLAWNFCPLCGAESVQLEQSSPGVYLHPALGARPVWHDPQGLTRLTYESDDNGEERAHRLLFALSPGACIVLHQVSACGRIDRAQSRLFVFDRGTVRTGGLSSTYDLVS